MRHHVNPHLEEEQKRHKTQDVTSLTFGVLQQTEEHSSHHVVSKDTDSDVTVMLFVDLSLKKENIANLFDFDINIKEVHFKQHQICTICGTYILQSL